MQPFSIMLNTEKQTDGNLSSQNTIYTDLDEERKFYFKKNKKNLQFIWNFQWNKYFKLDGKEKIKIKNFLQKFLKNQIKQL